MTQPVIIVVAAGFIYMFDLPSFARRFLITVFAPQKLRVRKSRWSSGIKKSELIG